MDHPVQVLFQTHLKIPCWILRLQGTQLFGFRPLETLNRGFQAHRLFTAAQFRLRIRFTNRGVLARYLPLPPGVWDGGRWGYQTYCLLLFIFLGHHGNGTCAPLGDLLRVIIQCLMYQKSYFKTLFKQYQKIKQVRGQDISLCTLQTF